MGQTFQETVDELQNVLDGIPDRPTLKLMTFDELKKKVSKKGKEPTKRQKTYKALKDKLENVKTTLENATLQGVENEGGPQEFQQKFELELSELDTAIKTYQKRHKGKKAKAVAPLLTDIEEVRGKMGDVVKSLGSEKEKAFKKATPIEDIANFSKADEVLAKSLDMVSKFDSDALANLTMADLVKNNGKQSILDEVNKELAKLTKAIKESKNQGEDEIGKALLAEITRVRQSISDQLDTIADKAKSYPPNMRLADARVIKPEQLKGISLAHCEFNKYNTSQEKPPPKKSLGKGNVNEVFQINYADGPRVFKEEKSSDSGSAWAPIFLGIDKKNDPRYGNRNVASGLVGEFLGSTVLDKCTFAINGDKVGLLMKKADGDSPTKMHGEKMKDRKTLFDDGLSDKALASLQKQMMELEVCDLISGQADRHGDNYLIEVKGDEVTVKGIDNDFAFGKTNCGGVPLNMPGAFRNITNMPRLMGSEMAEKILKGDFEKDFAVPMAELLTQEEISAARERFTALQKHVIVLRDTKCLVDDWVNWRSDPEKLTVREFLAPKNDNDLSSYFARDLDKYFPKK